MRYFVKLAYNGTNYHGWQYQPNAASVQENLNKAFSVILNSAVELMGAGRTDTGVHAREMFAHFNAEIPFDPHTLVHKINSFLPKDIVVFAIFPVHEDAHARFDAKKRTYEYHIHTFKNVFLQDLSWHCPHKLDIPLMNEAAHLLLEHTDFECFSKVHTDVNTFNCHITEAIWKAENGHLVFTISADRFLRNMVRAIVGTLVNVGIGKLTAKGFNTVIESKKRSEAGFSVPAHGLYLTEITYDYINSNTVLENKTAINI